MNISNKARQEVRKYYSAPITSRIKNKSFNDLFKKRFHDFMNPPD